MRIEIGVWRLAMGIRGMRMAIRKRSWGERNVRRTAWTWTSIGTRVAVKKVWKRRMSRRAKQLSMEYTEHEVH